MGDKRYPFHSIRNLEPTQHGGIQAAPFFVRVRVPSYFVPLNARGKLAMVLSFHRNPVDLVPESLLDLLARLRA
jgi:hypothetical protein